MIPINRNFHIIFFQEKRQKEQQKAQKKAAAASALALQSKKKEIPKLTHSNSGLVLTDLVTSFSKIPPFVDLCVTFIESEGLDSEGLYRVNGNRAHVELLIEKFKEGKISQICDFFNNSSQIC